jgi:hypothetical protein
LCDLSHLVGRHVRTTRDCSKHRDALSSRLNAAFAKSVNRAEGHWWKA